MKRWQNLKVRLPAWLSGLILLVFGPASIFYLFILPMWTATDPAKFGPLGVAFASFLLGQVVLLTLDQATEAAGRMYGVKLRGPIYFLRKIRLQPSHMPAPSRSRAIISMFLAYVLIQYMYAVVYVFVSNIGDNHFSTGNLSPLDGMYFSVITASTVGYGEIHPISGLAKMIVMSQVMVSLFYVVLIFSACASFLRDQPAKRDMEADKVASKPSEH